MGNAFFSHEHRSCYRQWLPKILGEHHATEYPQGKCGHKRILELLAAKLALLPFINGESIGSIHFQTDKKALSCLVKMEATGCSTLVRMSKENWDISMFKDITVTVEYLPSALNQQWNDSPDSFLANANLLHIARVMKYA